MKKILTIISITSLAIISCSKTRTCTCNDHTGKLISLNRRTSDPKDIKKFEDECRQTKVASFSGTTTVYTPCEISK